MSKFSKSLNCTLVDRSDTFKLEGLVYDRGESVRVSIAAWDSEFIAGIAS